MFRPDFSSISRTITFGSREITTRRTQNLGAVRPASGVTIQGESGKSLGGIGLHPGAVFGREARGRVIKAKRFERS
jgi:hypothetical protein